MKRFFGWATLIVVLAFVAGSANAQEVEKKISRRKQLEMRIAESFRETRTDSLTMTEQESILRGDTRVFDPEHRNMLGGQRHNFGIVPLVGCNYVDRQLNPSFTLRGMFETCHQIVEVEATISRQKHTIESLGYGSSYLTWQFRANFGYKVWQDRLCRNYLAIVVGAGYGLQQTDKREAQFYSKNFGFTGGAGLRVSASLAPRVKFVCEGGYNIYPRVIHSHGKQDFKHSGPYINAGVAFMFRPK